jgi:hypothetical protein
VNDIEWNCGCSRIRLRAIVWFWRATIRAIGVSPFVGFPPLWFICSHIGGRAADGSQDDAAGTGINLQVSTGTLTPELVTDCDSVEIICL